MKSEYINCRFLYEDSANNMNRVVPLEDGSLFTLGVIKRDLGNMGAYIKHQFIFYRKSFDGGKTWTPPKTLFEIPEQQIYTDLAQFMISRDGFLHVFMFRIWKYSFEKNEFKGDILHARMDDTDGSNLKIKKVECLDRYTGALNNLIQLESGRLVVPFSTLDENTGTFRSSTIYSDDEGITWEASNQVSVESDETHVESGAVEPVVAEVADNILVMIIRTVLGVFYYSISNNGGESWSQSRKSNIKSSNSPAVLQKLNDGRILMVWNNCSGMPMRGLRYSMARQCLHAAVSDDGLKTLKGARIIVQKHKEDPDNVLNCYPFLAPANGNDVYLRIMTVQTKDGEDWNDPGAKLLSVNTDFLYDNCQNSIPDDINVKESEGKPGYVYLNFPYGQKGILEIKYENLTSETQLYLILSDNYIDVSSLSIDVENERYRRFIEENYIKIPVNADKGKGIIEVAWDKVITICCCGKTQELKNIFKGFNHIGLLLNKGEIIIKDFTEKSEKAWMDTGIEY